jgi:hypothetical protein
MCVVYKKDCVWFHLTFKFYFENREEFLDISEIG